MISTHARLFRSTPRALAIAFLLVTFVAAQHEIQRHTLTHVAEQFRPHDDRGLQSPASGLPCIECSLLAGGTHVVPGSPVSLATELVNAPRHASAFLTRMVVATAFYSSRAPPPLL